MDARYLKDMYLLCLVVSSNPFVKGNIDALKDAGITSVSL